VKKQIPNQKNLAIGIAILVGFSFVCLLGNASLAYLTDHVVPRDALAILMWMIAGFIFSQGALLTLWLSLSSDHVMRRVIMFVAGSAAAFASWHLGYLFNLDIYSSFSRQTSSGLFAFGFLPVFLFGLSIPFLGIRFLLGRQLVRQESLKPEKGSTKPRFSIATLLSLTTVVAFVGGSVELTRFGFVDDADFRWFAAGICLAVSTGFSLLGIVPLLFWLLREKSLGAMVVVSVFWSIAIGATTTAINHAITRRNFPLRWQDESTAMGLIAFFFLIGVIVGSVGIRFLGFRLVKLRA